MTHFFSCCGHTKAYMNYERKSTVGWSIGNVLLDFTGTNQYHGQRVVIQHCTMYCRCTMPFGFESYSFFVSNRDRPLRDHPCVTSFYFAPWFLCHDRLYAELLFLLITLYCVRVARLAVCCFQTTRFVFHTSSFVSLLIFVSLSFTLTESSACLCAAFRAA